MPMTTHNEYFHRRDLTGSEHSAGRATAGDPIDDDYTEYYIGEYTDLGLAFLTDLAWKTACRCCWEHATTA
ncbi:MAG: hypothetical protein CM15mP120_04450 [Pseudomonadota bacterium]|nr:MAG: hypothetical protein CM15mP120_04450 [Pseudomonadota bacterium]